MNKKEDDNGVSGIDIEEAKRKLKDEDQFDKQLYRERIKRIHREKRLKEKEVRRAKRVKTDGGAEAVLDDQSEVTLNNHEGEESDFE